MLAELQSILDNECRLKRDDLLLIAVSGGPDSLCLLDILWRLGFRLQVAHFDHRLRAESGADAEAVHRAAVQRSLAFHLGAADVGEFSRRSKLSLEEGARILRYRFLFEQAERIRAQAVVTGHTADDQVETILMHLLRGSGLDGLQGMAYRAVPNPWSQTIPLLRPLLGTWRDQIEEYIQVNNLQPVLDATNAEPRYYRNRLRLELIPKLEQLKPGASQRIWQMAQVIRQDSEIILQAVSASWQACWLESGEDWMAFDLTALRQQPPALQRHLLRRAILQLRPGMRDLDYAALERGRRFILSPPRSQQSDLLGGLRLQIDGDNLYLAGWQASWAEAASYAWPQLADDEIIPIDLPFTHTLLHGWVLRARIVTDVIQAHQAASANSDPLQAWIDTGRTGGTLQLRSRKTGERFQPFGLDGHTVKLSDWMINEKIPAAARDRWPMVACGDQIAWVAGLRLAHPYRLTTASQAAVHLRLLKPASSEPDIDEKLEYTEVDIKDKGFKGDLA
jgi:tRNA(Ile)-lysidine synthase